MKGGLMRLNRCLFLLPLLLASPGCNDEGDTFVVNSDCGLIRTDMLGTYTVTFTPATPDLINCSDPSFNGSAVTVTSAPQDFTDVQVFASAFNTGFTFTDGSVPQGLYGNAETDSCAMSFSVLDNEEIGRASCRERG